MDQAIPPEVLELARALLAAGVGTPAVVPSDPPRIHPYTVAELADMSGFHRATLYRDIGEGRLKALRGGRGRGTIRVPVAAWEQYLKDTAARAVTTPRPRTSRARRLRGLPAGGAA